MLFQLYNASGIFQDYINKIFIEKPNLFVIIYMNNILIYIKDFGQSYIKAIC